MSAVFDSSICPTSRFVDRSLKILCYVWIVAACRHPTVVQRPVTECYEWLVEANVIGHVCDTTLTSAPTLSICLPGYPSGI